MMVYKHIYKHNILYTNIIASAILECVLSIL